MIKDILKKEVGPAAQYILIAILSGIIGIFIVYSISQHQRIDSLYTRIDQYRDSMEQASDDIDFLNDYVETLEGNIELKQLKITLLEKKIEVLETQLASETSSWAIGLTSQTLQRYFIKWHERHPVFTGCFS